MDFSYLTKKQDDGSYVARVGWRKVGYAISQEEHQVFEQTDKFYTVITLGLLMPCMLYFVLWRDPLAEIDGTLWEFLAMCFFSGLVAVLVWSRKFVVSKKIRSENEPFDKGTSKWEQRRVASQKAWRLFKYLAAVNVVVILLLAFLGGQFEFQGVLLYGQILLLVQLMESLYFNYISTGVIDQGKNV